MSALCGAAFAQNNPSNLPLLIGQGAGGTTYSVPIQTLLMFTALSFLPAVLLLMTGFTRIVIVLSLLRQALGTQAAPPNQVIVGLSAVPHAVRDGADDRHASTHEAYEPLQANKISFNEALNRGEVPLREFMLKQTRQSDVQLFAKLAKLPAEVKSEDVPFKVLVPAFVTSELKSAFQIGFLIFIPFLVIDMIVASVLMSLGMMMLSPGAGGAAVQADAVRAGRRLEPAARLAGCVVRHMKRTRVARRGGRYPAGAPTVAVGLAGRLRCDARSAVAPRNSLHSLRSLRSNNRGESDHEARAARAPTALLRFSPPHKSPPPGTAHRAATLVVFDDECHGGAGKAAGGCAPAATYAAPRSAELMAARASARFVF